MKRNLLSVVSHGPDLSRPVVAVNIGPAQFGKLRTQVRHAAGDRPRFAVGMHEGRFCKRMRPRLALSEMKYGCPLFDNAPAEVVSATDDFNHFPLILTDVAAPQVALRIEMNPPRIAKAVGPQLGPRLGQFQKRIVGRNRIIFSGGGVLDVDPQHSRNEIADLLAGEVRVGIAGAVAGRDIEHAVGPEGQVAAVMSVRFPFDDDLLAGRVACPETFAGTRSATHDESRKFGSAVVFHWSSVRC